MSWFFTGLLVGVYTPQLVSVMLPYTLCAFLTLTAVLVSAGAWRWALGLLLGVLLQVTSTIAAVDARLSPEVAGDSLVVRCTVSTIPAVSAQAARFDAHCDGPVELPTPVRLSWHQPAASVRVGDRWQWVVRLRPPGGLSNPGRRDPEASVLAAGTRANGYVVRSSRNRLLATTATPVAQWREAIRQRIRDVLPHRSAAAVVVALATGIRHDMTNAQWDRFRASGTSHLVAISGLHVGLVAAMVVWLSRPVLACVLRSSSARRASVCLGLVAALVFAVLSGWGVPAQRACLMVLAVVLAGLARRETSGSELLAVAGSLVLVSDTLASLSTGFMLSFAAVAVLLWLFRPLPARPGESPTWRIGRLPGLQVGLFFGLLPAVALTGQPASLVAPLVNLVAVPLFSLVTVPATLLGVLLMPLAQDAPWFRIAAWSVDGFSAFADHASGLPTLRVAIWVSLPALLWVVLPVGFPGRAAALLTLPAMLLSPGRSVPEGCFDAHFLDVGQGTAIVVETRSQTLLYDTGPAYRSGRSAAELNILPFMRARRVDRIDTLIVSHADSDHAGGLAAIVAELTPSWIYAGEPLPGVEVSYCHAGQAWIDNGIGFRFLYPHRPLAESGNNASCVLEVSAGTHRLLLTGDIERDAERRLLSTGLRRAAVVSVPHHGSRTSSTLPFVRAVAARYAIVSAAAENRWGLPIPDVVARWKSAGSEFINVGLAGYTRMRLCEDSGAHRMHSQRDRQRRWWQPTPVD